MATKKTKAAVGTGIAALAAAAAGIYFLYGTKEGAKRRRKIRAWMLKAKGEVLERMEALPTIDKETYFEIVDDVTDRYRNMKDATASEVEILKKEMKKYWKDIQKEISPKKDSEK